MAFALLLAVAEQPVNQASSAALYTAVASVLVALIGGAAAVLVNRSRNSTLPPVAPRVDEPTTYALPREMADMLVEVIAERDVWKNRAIRLGWRDSEL